MAEMSLEQQRAVALASARLRLQDEPQQQSAAERVANDPISRGAREVLETSPADLIAANPVTRFFTGAASPILGAAQRLEEGIFGTTGGRDRARQLEEMQARGNRAVDMSLAGGTSDVTGSLFSPAFLAAAKVAPAASYAGRVGQGAGIGTLAGVTAPRTDEGSALPGAAVGAGIGSGVSAVSPLVSAVAKGGYHALVEPWMNNAAIKGRAFLEAAGDKADDIINLLRQNKQIVTGSVPTAGEAAVPAGRAEFSALQRSAERVAPSAYLARSDEQNAARLGAVRSVGQTPADLAAAEGSRKAQAAINYGDAYKQAIVADPVLARISSNPYVKDAIPDAIKLAEAQGINGKSDLTRFLHFVKLSLDKQLTRTGDTALSHTERAAVQNAKERLVIWMGQKNPLYDKARTEFAKASVPINQMQVGQYLEEKLVPALSEDAKQRAGTYSQALRDAPGTIKRATTGGPRFDELTQVLTPQQMQAVNSVRDDLARGARFDTMAVAGKGTANAVDVASGSMEREAGGKLPQMLHRGAMIANAIISRVEGKINRKLAAEIASEMLNPPGVAETMAKTLARQRSNADLADAITRYRGAATGGVIQAIPQQREEPLPQGPR